MSNKSIYLNSEGNKWLLRNDFYLEKKNWGQDIIIKRLKNLVKKDKKRKYNILEIGCSNGKRLEFIKNFFNSSVYGIDPSSYAVKKGLLKKLKIKKGTADLLPYQDSFFDIIIYGFCLYLCDLEDFFLIAKEGDRVLKRGGKIIILDFFSQKKIIKKDKHNPNVNILKMNFSKIFTWHPNFNLISKKRIDYMTLKTNGNKNAVLYVIEKISD
jgi:ubiquinone/menaquinone biosynthesis C-methylase UbiE